MKLNSPLEDLLFLSDMIYRLDMLNAAAEPIKKVSFDSRQILVGLL